MQLLSARPRFAAPARRSAAPCPHPAARNRLVPKRLQASSTSRPLQPSEPQERELAIGETRSSTLDFYFTPLYGPYLFRKTTLTRLGERLWCLEQPLTLAHLVETNRVFIVRLKSGGLWVYGALPPTAGFLSLLASLGEPVKYLVLNGSLADHYSYMPALAAALPEAKVYVHERVAGAAQAHLFSWILKDQSMAALDALGDRLVRWSGEAVPPEWRPDIEAVAVVSSEAFTETVFLARGAVAPGEGTLMAMDFGALLGADPEEVLPAFDQPSPVKRDELFTYPLNWAARMLSGSLSYHGFVAELVKAGSDITHSNALDAMQRSPDPTPFLLDLERVRALNFKSATGAHGCDPCMSNGRQRFETIYGGIIARLAQRSTLPASP